MRHPRPSPARRARGFTLAEVLAALQRWADDELRSLNGQIEFLLRQALARRGEKVPEGSAGDDAPSEK